MLHTAHYRQDVLLQNPRTWSTLTSGTIVFNLTTRIFSHNISDWVVQLLPTGPLMIDGPS